MKFPKAIKYRGKVLATIYGKSASYPRYRVAWHVHGKRLLKAFRHYGEKEGAQPFAERLAKDLAKGSPLPATPVSIVHLGAAQER